MRQWLLAAALEPQAPQELSLQPEGGALTVTIWTARDRRAAVRREAGEGRL